MTNRLSIFFIVGLSVVSTFLYATEIEDEEESAATAKRSSIVDAAPAGTVDENTNDEQAVANQQPLTLLNSSVEPGSFNTLHWSSEQSFASIATPVPVLIAHGAQSGPVLCMTAAVHGDELNGIEMVRRLMYDLEPATLRGTVIGVPIVNIDGFRRGERYLSDRRDLNRHFPGSADGSAAARIAYNFFTNVVTHCDYLVDLHTGSMARSNLPQIRGNLKKPEIVELAKHLGGITVLHDTGAAGTLRRAATDSGIPSLTMEAGGPHVLEEGAVDYGVKALETLLDNLGMRKSSRFWSAPQPVFYESEWIRAGQGGILLSQVKLGDKVKEGQVLGTVVDPVSNTGSAILASFNGRILGIALNQVVMTGYAAYHVGVEKAAEKVEQEAEQSDDVSTQKTPTSESDSATDTIVKPLSDPNASDDAE